jgi:Fe-S cluster assembly protein SufD
MAQNIFIENINSQLADSKIDFNLAEEAIKNFNRLGIPTVKNEEWKYTSLKEIENLKFGLKSKINNISKASFKEIQPLDLKTNEIVFVNGVFDRESSSFISLETELSITEFKSLSVEQKKKIVENFGRYKKYNLDGLIALNEVFQENCILIEVIKSSKLSFPININYISEAESTNCLSIPKVLIDIEEDASADFIENFITIGTNISFTNTITEFCLAENANISYYKIQNEGPNTYHAGTTQVNQNGKSTFKAVTVTLDGKIVRNNLNISINKPYSETHLFGLALLEGENHIDNHTVVDHVMPNCESNETYKTILDQNASGVFNGKIFVRPDAQKTNAYQKSKNILLSDTANVYAKPQLEIWADDVKCSHGSTTGQLDKEALFYLKARGIGEQTAKAMLTKAFAQDILNAIDIEPLKIYLEGLIEKRFNRE